MWNKLKFREEAEKFAAENGYSDSVVENFVAETENLVDMLGDEKFSELISRVFSEVPGLKKIGAERKDNNADEKLSAKNAPVRPLIKNDEEKNDENEATDKDFDAIASKLSEDLSLLTEPHEINVSRVRSFEAEFDSAADSKEPFISIIAEENESFFVFRLPAKCAIKIAGAMVGMPENIIEDKIKTLKLEGTDLIDGIKEIGNQFTGSLKNALAGRDFKLKEVVFMDFEKEKKIITGSGRCTAAEFEWTLGGNKLEGLTAFYISKKG